MLLDYEFHTVLKYETITHISCSHHDPIEKKQTNRPIVLQKK